jgi:hypothetical protein
MATSTEDTDAERAASLRYRYLIRFEEDTLQATGSRPGAVCGLRSGVAVRKDAELVPLWVGKYDPALIAGLADVGVPGT